MAMLVIGWAVFVFGAAADGYRTVAGALTALGGILGLLFLPAGERRLRVPWLFAVGAGWLLVFGWFMVWNATAEHSLVSWTFTAVESRPWSAAPGSVARATSLRSVLELTAVVIGMLAVLKSTTSCSWRALILMFAGTGALVGLVGILHKVAGAETVWWIDDRPHGAAFFAPYVYHANAGAFLNLCLPLALGLWLSALDTGRSRSSAIAWGMVAIIIAASIIVTASKGAILVMLVVLAAMGVWNFRRLSAWLRGALGGKRARFERLFLALGLFVLGAVLIGFGIGLTVQRWEEFVGRFGDTDRESIDARIGIMKLMARMASPAEGSWHGFGPGTFRHLVPYFTVGEAGEGVSRGRWLHGHSDPLQTLVEWGYAGALGWLLFAVGAVFSGAVLLRRRMVSSMDVPVVRGMIVALFGVGLHSCFDFPLSNYSIHLVAMTLCTLLFGLRARRAEMAPDHLAETSRMST